MSMILKDQRYLDMASKIINEASKEILISQFKIDSCGIGGKSTVNQLLVALALKAEKGIKIKILLDCILPLKARSANNRFVALWLKKRNMCVKYLANNRCQHAKIIEVDGSHVIIGSHNWTVNSLTRNSEVSIYLTDNETIKQVIVDYEQEFERAVEYKDKI